MLSLQSTTAEGQTPPCLGPYQRVAALVPVPAQSEPIGLHVDGHDAVLWNLYSGGYPFRYGLHLFREDPSTGTWSATESRRYPGPTLNYTQVALSGGVLAFMHLGDPTIEVVVLERDPITAAWLRIGAVPVGSVLQLYELQLHVSRELVALQERGGAQSTVWRRGPADYTLAVSFPFNEPSLLAVDGEHFVRALPDRAELYRCPASGGAELLGYVPAPVGKRFMTKLHLEGERLVANIGPASFAQLEGIATWRIAWGTPSETAAVLDTVELFSAGLPAGTGISNSSFGADSLLTPRYLPCTVAPFGTYSASIVDIDAQGRIHVVGDVCVDAHWTSELGHHTSTDGRTVARMHKPYGSGTSVEFARYLGAAHDRDRDCVPDTDQIRIDPRLDVNANARLDAYERVGDVFCAQPAPNSTGSFASLELIGSEHVSSTDLAAVARALPPLALGTSTFTFAPMPLPAQATSALGLCILGARHPAVVADTGGVAVTAIHPSALPTRGGSASALAGQTWAWQHVYRDGATLAATPAVAVQLW